MGICDAIKENLENYWVDESEDSSLNLLEIVNFGYFKGLKVELELVRFILTHSPLLKTMYIHYDPYIKKDVAVTLTEEMVQYFKASIRAQIRHSEEKPVCFFDL